MITDNNKSFILTYGNINVDEHLEKNPIEIVDRPDLKDHHIEHFLNHPDQEMRMYIATRQNLKPEHIDRLIHDESPHVVESVVSDHWKRMSKNQVDHVFKHGNLDSKYWIAKSSHLDPSQLDHFVNHQSGDIRYSASQNKNLSQDHIRKLSGDENFHVRMYISNREDTPDHVLHGMLSDSNEYVRGNARSNLARRK